MPVGRKWPTVSFWLWGRSCLGPPGLDASCSHDQNCGCERAMGSFPGPAPNGANQTQTHYRKHGLLESQLKIEWTWQEGKFKYDLGLNSNRSCIAGLERRPQCGLCRYLEMGGGVVCSNVAGDDSHPATPQAPLQGKLPNWWLFSWHFWLFSTTRKIGDVGVWNRRKKTLCAKGEATPAYSVSKKQRSLTYFNVFNKHQPPQSNTGIWITWENLIHSPTK